MRKKKKKEGITLLACNFGRLSKPMLSSSCSEKIRGRQDEAEFDMSIVINLSLLLSLFTNVCVNPVSEQLVL